VQVILDKSQRTEKYSSADFLANQGVPTMIDAHHAIAHNKVIVIDGETVLTGSFNFTKAAQEKNAEHVRRISGGEQRNPVAKRAEISCTHPTHPRR
jgi:phosphatidylserine/phosphatidylglycerophosphate/cardiolipin synthase-like enzyme